MVDVATGKLVKPNNLVMPDSNKNIGDRIMTLSPALYRGTKDNFVLLAQEVILVELYEPLRRRHANKESTSQQLG